MQAFGKIVKSAITRLEPSGLEKTFRKPSINIPVKGMTAIELADDVAIF